MIKISTRRPPHRKMVKRNGSLHALLSSFGALVILVLFTAGICDELLRRRIA